MNMSRWPLLTCSTQGCTSIADTLKEADVSVFDGIEGEADEFHKCLEQVILSAFLLFAIVMVLYQIAS